ncbi:hypothetical protein [Neobacillus piezotolerans]|uniref:hypothetical protein n=1 Tax=Neobacillus piezotolerans TaxID=2259171 RepID=UPI00115B8E3E|nr:hypothetical protein [Neobacillus piezotolerans]
MNPPNWVAYTAVLKEQLADAIQTHTEISDYMVEMSYCHPADLSSQFEVDLTAAQTAVNLGEKQ